MNRVVPLHSFSLKSDFKRTWYFLILFSFYTEDQWDSAIMLDEPAHIAMPASRRRLFATRRRMAVSRGRSSRISFRTNVRYHRNDSNNGHVVKPSSALTAFGILVAILTITKRLFQDKV